jgi:hypothetical protein
MILSTRHSFEISNQPPRFREQYSAFYQNSRQSINTSVILSSNEGVFTVILCKKARAPRKNVSLVQMSTDTGLKKRQVKSSLQEERDVEPVVVRGRSKASAVQRPKGLRGLALDFVDNLFKPVSCESLTFMRVFWGFVMAYEMWTYMTGSVWCTLPARTTDRRFELDDWRKAEKYLVAPVFMFKFPGFEW